MVGDPKDATRPPPDKVFDDIADYVHNYKIDSDLAYNTARLCLMDTIGCVGSLCTLPRTRSLRRRESRS
jgi:2-methylcitrate dehydratase